MLLPNHRRLSSASPLAEATDHAQGRAARGNMRRELTCRLWPILPGWAKRLAVRLVMPRVSLGACAVIHDSAGRVLLARHTYRRQPWDLPGGFVRRGEQPATSLQRELREELGVSALIEPLLAAATTGSHLTLYYRATLAEAPRPDGVEIDGYRFVAVADIPALLGWTPGWLAWAGAAVTAARPAA